MKQSSLLTFLAILAIFHYANCTDSSGVCKNVPKKKDDSDEIAFAIVGKRKRLKCPLTEAYGDQATDVCWWFTNENGTKMHNLNNNNDSIYVINSTFLTILWNRVTLNNTVFLCQSSDGRIWEFKFAIIDCNNATVCNNRGKCIEKHVGTPMHSVHCICSSSNYRGEYCEITKSPYPFLITIIFTCPIIAIVWLLLHGENPQMSDCRTYLTFPPFNTKKDTVHKVRERVNSTTYCQVGKQHKRLRNEVLKVDLKKMFIPLKSEMSLRTEFCRLRHVLGNQSTLSLFENQLPCSTDALLEKESTTTDEARRIALIAVEIEEASRNMDVGNNMLHDRRIEELTGALDWFICRLDDRLPPRCDNAPTPTPAKPAPTADVYQRKHQATIEARLERTLARPARTGTGCFNCGSLDHLRRNYPELRSRTRPAGAQRRSTKRLRTNWRGPGGRSSGRTQRGPEIFKKFLIQHHLLAISVEICRHYSELQVSTCISLAAEFGTNGNCIRELYKVGFGFVEIGDSKNSNLCNSCTAFTVVGKNIRQLVQCLQADCYNSVVNKQSV
ncbi:hypothetical protein T05_7661 [Trichinella murrelli]|uniref:EGF-like domain-containing protein n=1 Tax=Trichinella murrelli TaxID=144512 RepID=A0A0V0TN00_9BILA|nr:hypothetical protein T05_7661 [Trichinella murrelli]